MSSTSDSGKAVNPPLQGSVYLELAKSDWQPDGDKFWIKPLYENPAKGERTCLMKIDPGAWFPMHAHEETEQIYVLSGSFYDQDRTLRAGDYACRAPGAMHTAGSDEGAVVLLIYSRS
jgi:quercetin dioxygenase-like cupin family protein